MAITSAVLILVAVVGGIVVGELGGFALGRRLLRPVDGGPVAAAYVSKSARNGGIFGSIPGLICSFPIGGNLGGGAGYTMLGPIGAPIGIFLGISIILGAMVLGGHVIGGRLAARTTLPHDA
jgi:hypothetical protein